MPHHRSTVAEPAVHHLGRGRTAAVLALVLALFAALAAGAPAATAAATGSIAGKVTDEAGNPLSYVDAAAHNVTTGAITSAFTGADGTYTIVGLAAGSYKLEFGTHFAGGNHTPEWWNDKPSAATAATITVGAGQQVTGKNAVLVPGATISGAVTGPGGAAVDAQVYLSVSFGEAPGDTDTFSADGAGHFTLTGLRPGKYWVSAYASGYASTYWKGTFDDTKAVPIVVAKAADAVTGVNFQLAHQLTWRHPTITGTGQVGAPLTANTSGWTAGTSFTYQWNDGGVPIKGATASTFIPRAAQQTGWAISVTVTGSKQDYAPVTVESDMPYTLVTSANAQLGYQGHVQGTGWQPWVTGGKAAGTTGRALRVEALRFRLNKPAYSGGITATAHVQGIGWMAPVTTGGLVGTTGRSLRVEAFTIKLTGEMAKHYDIYYRTHAQNLGWLGWAKNGAQSGTAGYSYRLEAVDVRLVAKGDPAPTSTGSRAFYQR